jgi:uncharacterized protein YjeT (DUF2065 family)
MPDLLAALGLAFVLEGAAYALAPNAMRRLMERALLMPDAQLRLSGLLAAALGLLLVWLARGA